MTFIGIRFTGLLAAWHQFVNYYINADLSPAKSSGISSTKIQIKNLFPYCILAECAEFGYAYPI